MFPQKNLSLKDFRLSVADFLIGVSNRPKKGRPSTKSPTNKAKSMPTEAVRTSQVPHFSAKVAEGVVTAVQNHLKSGHYFVVKHAMFHCAFRQN